MKTTFITMACVLSILCTGTINAQTSKSGFKMKELTTEEKRVILDKGTERAFTGEYNNNKAEGTYICRQCGAHLYQSKDKFESNCGWPSFDDEIKGAIKRELDADGRRTEILCASCDGHLGHVFIGEEITSKNTRHCVNSISMVFVPTREVAIFAGGCFWGVEHLMQQQPGVIDIVSGEMGGEVEKPSEGMKAHAEVVQITYDPLIVDYRTLAKLFFEIHDPTQVNGQGPDIGPGYRSEIFYMTQQQEEIAKDLIEELEAKGYDIATKVTPASIFYKAGDHHQDYYKRKGTEPYCHAYVKRF